MDQQKLCLPMWDNLPDAERVELAGDVVRAFAGRFRLVGIESFALAEQRHHVAVFDHEGAPFHLIPGGTVMLGYDPEQFRPSPQQDESWAETASEYGLDGTIADYMKELLTPPRTVTLSPFLMEASARPGSERMPLKQGVRVKWLTYEQERERLAQRGFRFATSDEWEFACGAGSRTLFRWGDGELPECSPGARAIDRSGWDLHHRPNAFGLRIAGNPYHCELVARPQLLRGGDGGAMCCGAAGWFVEWLTLASAFLDPHVGRHYADEPMPDPWIRRVVSLA